MNFVLLIGESIGWQELIIIGVLALIIFGPRKIPELARKAGKIMSEFRRATSEFKTTWESEVSTITTDIKDELKDVDNDMRMLAVLENPKPVENSIGRNSGALEENGNSTNGNQMELPTIKEVEPPQLSPAAEEESAEVVEETVADNTVKTKKDWF
jgi:Tat protein translocase TatB subunit